VRQLAALVAAVALIVLALAVRDLIADGETGSGERRDPVVVCPVELATVCDALDEAITVRSERTATTAAALGAGEASEAGEGADVWITTRPWADAVADQRARAGADPLPGEPSDPIARSPVALVVWDDRTDVLTDGPCAGDIGWRCLGDAAERPWSELGGPAGWGVVKVGLTSPDTAGGLVVLGGVAAGFFGGSDYASNDFGGELSGWLGALGANPVAAGDEPVARMLTRGPGEFSAVGALEADARRAADRADVQVIYPAPVAVAELVAVPVGGDGGVADDVAADDDLGDALAAAGWRVDGRPPAAGVDEGIDITDDGLPGGAVLQALHTRWREVTG
jgi:hypothetical protein